MIEEFEENLEQSYMPVSYLPHFCTELCRAERREEHQGAGDVELPLGRIRDDRQKGRFEIRQLLQRAARSTRR